MDLNIIGCLVVGILIGLAAGYVLGRLA